MIHPDLSKPWWIDLKVPMGAEKAPLSDGGVRLQIPGGLFNKIFQHREKSKFWVKHVTKNFFFLKIEFSSSRRAKWYINLRGPTSLKISCPHLPMLKWKWWLSFIRAGVTQIGKGSSSQPTSLGFPCLSFFAGFFCVLRVFHGGRAASWPMSFWSRRDQFLVTAWPI